jgi:hypothetical protein
MGVPNEAFRSGDVFIDFPQEHVMFHFVKDTGKVFRKFYGKSSEDEIPHTSSLFAEAQIFGSLTTPERYIEGGPKQ